MSQSSDRCESDEPREPASAMTARTREVLFVLAAQVFLIMLGIGLVSPILPLYGQSFGVGAAAVGSLVTVFGVARMFVNIPAGHLAERFGRKVLLVGGPLVTTIGSIGIVFASSFWQLLALRVVQGVGSAALTTAAMIVVADISTTENRGRVMSVYQGSLLLGAGTGPAVGGLVAEAWGVRAPFALYAALAALAALWALLRVPETRSATTPAPASSSESSSSVASPATKAIAKRPRAQLLRNPDFLLVGAVTLGIFFTRSGGRMTLLPLLGHNELGMSESAIGLVFTVISACNFLALYAAGSLSDRFGRKAVIVPSGFVTALATWLFLYSGDVTWFFLTGVLLGLATGLGGPAPAAYVADIVPEGAVGPTMGLYRTVGDLGLVIGPVLLGWIVDVAGFREAFVTNALLLVVITAAFVLFARETVTRRGRGGRAEPGGGRSAEAP